MSAPTSRLVRMMCARLGDAHWAAFVVHADRHYKAAFVHADRHYKAAFVCAFAGPKQRCVGPVGGEGGCPHAFAVDLAAPGATLECLHLEHE